MPSKKSISIIGPSFRFLSGISYYTVYLSNSLSRHYAVNAVLFRNMLPKKLFPGAGRVGKSLTNVEYSSGITKKELLDWYNPATWHRAAKTIEPSKACIFEWWTSSVAHMYFVIGHALKHRNIPIILEYHEVVDTLEDSILPIRLYAKFMGKQIRNLASSYIVHSAADRKLVAEHYHINQDKITVMPHGLYDQYAKLDKTVAKQALGISEEHIILFFGLLRPYKGVKYLIEAFEQLPEEILKNTALIIAGEAWEDTEAIERAKSSPLHDKIHLHSEYINDNDIPKFFSVADTLVLPYIRASQSGVAHIGISYGIPVVCSEVGGLVESMNKYNGTVFVPPTDTKALSNALTTVLRNPDTKYDIPKELKWETIAESWKELIQ